MSFLNNNGTKFLSSRITKKGRKAIAEGNFVITNFQIGDSEFDYNDPFSELNGVGNTPSQRVFAPFDMENGIKYPYKSENSTTYGIPTLNSKTMKLRNAMGPAGFVSDYIPFGGGDGTTIESPSESIKIKTIDGKNNITVLSPNKFNNCEYITLVFGDLGGTDSEVPMIVKNINSLIYKVVSISGNTLNLDRNTPDLSSLSGNAKIICNDCENEKHDGQSNILHHEQLNPWSLNIVWGEKPIGSDVSGIDENLTGYTSNMYVSTKEFLGYTTNNAQTFINSNGSNITNPTSFFNSFNEEILVNPSEQRCIAILHYSETGKPSSDTERFYKYDDYISYDDTINNTIAIDENGLSVSDSKYFQLFIPFINYHRNTGSTCGAVFYMENNNDNYIKSSFDDKQKIFYRNLIDEQGKKVGKIFAQNKTIVIDDQELIAILDYRSNRKYTLPSPKVVTVPSNVDASNSLLNGTNNQTVWVTYMLANSLDKGLNSLPCNYYNKISLDGLNSIPSQIGVRFNSNSFKHMKTSVSGLTNGYIADKFYVLAQLTNSGELPKAHAWKIIDMTDSISEHNAGSGNYIDPNNLENNTFTITKSLYNNATFFDLEDYMPSNNYLGDENYTNEPQFGDEQPFPGSIRVVRCTDIEEMNFLISLEATQFTKSQNPTYKEGKTKKITEIGLLNENGDTLVISKVPKPIVRNGSQIFTIKIDF